MKIIEIKKTETITKALDDPPYIELGLLLAKTDAEPIGLWFVCLFSFPLILESGAIWQNSYLNFISCIRKLLELYQKWKATSFFSFPLVIVVLFTVRWMVDDLWLWPTLKNVL